MLTSRIFSVSVYMLSYLLKAMNCDCLGSCNPGPFSSKVFMAYCKPDYKKEKIKYKNADWNLRGRNYNSAWNQYLLIFALISPRVPTLGYQKNVMSTVQLSNTPFLQSWATEKQRRNAYSYLVNSYNSVCFTQLKKTCFEDILWQDSL